MRKFFLCLIGIASSIGLGACAAPTGAESGYDYRHFGFARPGSTYGYGSTYHYPRYVYVPHTPHRWDRRWRRFDHDHFVRRDDDHHHDGWRSDKRKHKEPPVVEHEKRRPKVQSVPRIIDQLEAQGYSRIEPKKRRGRTLTVTAEDKQGGKSVLVIDRKTGRMIERPQVRP